MSNGAPSESCVGGRENESENDRAKTGFPTAALYHDYMFCRVAEMRFLFNAHYLISWGEKFLLLYIKPGFCKLSCRPSASILQHQFLRPIELHISPPSKWQVCKELESSLAEFRAFCFSPRSKIPTWILLFALISNLRFRYTPCNR